MRIGRLGLAALIGLYCACAANGQTQNVPSNPTPPLKIRGCRSTATGMPCSALPPASIPAAVQQPLQFVDFTGDDKNDGFSWNSAKKTVMAAYDALPSDGGTIEIMQGSDPDSDAIPATSTPGQGIWLMGGGDPNYSAPPAGWRRFKPNVSFIGVAGTSSEANTHAGGQVHLNAGGPSRNQPCIWLSGTQSPLRFENLLCTYQGRDIVIGETSNNLRDGTGAVATVTFENVGIQTLRAPGYGPTVDITGNSFWLYFTDCAFGANSQAPSLLDNAHAAILIDGTGNYGNGLIFISNLNTNSGGIKFIPGKNGGSLTVNGMTEEGQGQNGPELPPAIYLTSTSLYTMFNIQNIMVADPGPSGAQAVLIDGDGPAEAVLATGNLDGGVSGPATVMGQYPNGLNNTAESPAQMGQAGFFNGHVVGQVDAARRNFSPTAIRFPNIASQIPRQWFRQQDVSVQSGIPAPDGTNGAGQVTNAINVQEVVAYFSGNEAPPAVGDYFIGGAWIRSLSPTGGYTTSATTGLFLHLGDGNIGSGSTNGAISSGSGEWTWQWLVYKITAASSSVQFMEFGSIVAQAYPIQVYAPVFMHIPASAVSDGEAYEIARNLSSYPDGLPVGTVATLRGQQFAFGGTGNFFGVLSQSNTANRTYTFPDASGRLALTNLAQTWTAPQTLDSAILTDPMIDGQKLSAPPLATFGAFLPGALSGSYLATSFTPDYAITVTRVEVTLKTASQGCISSAVVSVRGSNNLDIPVPLDFSDSGPVNVAMNAGTPVQIVLATPAQGCSVFPQDANVVVHFRMQ